VTHICYPLVFDSGGKQRGIDDDRPPGRRAARGARKLGYDQAASGGLPSYKIGGTRRSDPDELRGWIAEHREGEPKQLKRRETTSMKRTRSKTTRHLDDEQPRLFE
jgi:hypothetical protein